MPPYKDIVYAFDFLSQLNTLPTLPFFSTYDYAARIPPALLPNPFGSDLPSAKLHREQRINGSDRELCIDLSWKEPKEPLSNMQLAVTVSYVSPACSNASFGGDWILPAEQGTASVKLPLYSSGQVELVLGRPALSRNFGSASQITTCIVKLSFESRPHDETLTNERMRKETCVGNYSSECSSAAD